MAGGQFFRFLVGFSGWALSRLEGFLFSGWVRNELRAGRGIYQGNGRGGQTGRQTAEADLTGARGGHNARRLREYKCIIIYYMCTLVKGKCVPGAAGGDWEGTGDRGQETGGDRRRQAGGRRQGQESGHTSDRRLRSGGASGKKD